MELEGKTILVTGASSGIGAAAALLFAAEGANVVLGARRETLLADIARQIDKQGGNAAYLAGDVRSEAYADALVDLSVRRFGQLDGAFNNAGILGELGPVTQMEAANWHEVIAVNLTGAFLAARSQLRVMRAQRRGSIASLHPMKRMANARESGQAAVFLLGERSSFMTGSPLLVDGGVSVRLA